MVIRALSFIWAIAWVVAATPALAQPPPPQEPILRIDPGMHTALIRRIGVDATCRLLVTGSIDKTVRLWGLPEGKLLRTLRPPIGPGNNGQVRAVTVAPDGSWVAAGGWSTSKLTFCLHFCGRYGRANGTAWPGAPADRTSHGLD